MTRTDVQPWLGRVTQISQALTSTLDYDATLQQVARLPIPALADWSMVYVPDDGGALPARLVLAHGAPHKEAALRSVWGREWTVLAERHPIAESLRKATPIVFPECDDSIFERLASVPDHAAALRRVGVRSLVALPLVAHGTLVGGLLLAAAHRRRPQYDPASLDSLGELARCCAQAIYNARLFVETRLALRLREELILGTRHELLTLLDGVRERRRDRARLLAWPESPGLSLAAAPSRPPRVSDVDSMAMELEEIADRLATSVGPYAARG